MCVCVSCTCGLLRVVAHEAEPRPLLLAVAKQVEEPHLLQLSLQDVQLLQTHDETSEELDDRRCKVERGKNRHTMSSSYYVSVSICRLPPAAWRKYCVCVPAADSVYYCSHLYPLPQQFTCSL